MEFRRTPPPIARALPAFPSSSQSASSIQHPESSIQNLIVSDPRHPHCLYLEVLFVWKIYEVQTTSGHECTQTKNRCFADRTQTEGNEENKGFCCLLKICNLRSLCFLLLRSNSCSFVVKSRLRLRR